METPYNVGDTIITTDWDSGTRHWTVEQAYEHSDKAKGVWLLCKKHVPFVPGTYQKYKNGKPLVTWGSLEIHDFKTETEMPDLIPDYEWVKVDVTATEA